MELILTDKESLRALVYEASREAVAVALRKRVLNADETCLELGIGLSTLGKIENELKPIERKGKKGAPRYYRREDIDEYVKSKSK